MKNQQSKTINFFSYVMGDDASIMSAIFGRKDITHEDATLHGYEYCIQTAKDVTNKVLSSCPFSSSPREILIKNRGPNFELYTIRPNSKNDIHGTIWYVTPEEYEYLRSYELIDCGLSEDIVANATTDNGKVIKINTYGIKRDVNNITKVVDADYKRPEIDKKEKIEKAIKFRRNFIKGLKSKT